MTTQDTQYILGTLKASQLLGTSSFPGTKISCPRRSMSWFMDIVEITNQSQLIDYFLNDDVFSNHYQIYRAYTPYQLRLPFLLPYDYK
jgi:hypothetical protein